jgi:hypothetical protein
LHSRISITSCAPEEQETHHQPTVLGIRVVSIN